MIKIKKILQNSENLSTNRLFMHDSNLLMQYYSTRISFKFEWGAPKGLLSPRAWAVQFCVARMWLRQEFSPLVFLVMCCPSTVKVVSAPLRVEEKLYELFHFSQTFWLSSSISIPQLKRSSRYHTFSLTPCISHKKHSFSLQLPLSRLQILIKSTKMYFTKAFTFAAIIFAGAAFAAPSSPMPAKPAFSTINQKRALTCSASGGIVACCNNGICVAQSNFPLSKRISWASILWGKWIFSYQPAKYILVFGSNCNGKRFCYLDEIIQNRVIQVVSVW